MASTDEEQCLSRSRVRAAAVALAVGAIFAMPAVAQQQCTCDWNESRLESAVNAGAYGLSTFTANQFYSAGVIQLWNNVPGVLNISGKCALYQVSLDGAIYSPNVELGNPPPVFLPDGQHQEVLICGAAACDSNGLNCSVQTTNSRPLQFIETRTPPTVTLDTAPLNNAILPLAPIELGGTFSSRAPSAVHFAGVNGSSSALSTGGNWKLEIDTAQLASIAAVAPAISVIGVYASDVVDNIVSFSTACVFPNGNGVGVELCPQADAAHLNPALARFVIIDRTPPTVTFDFGTSAINMSTITAHVSAISGTVQDDVRLGSLKLFIYDIPPNVVYNGFAAPVPSPEIRTWNQSARAFQHGDPVPIPVTINTGPKTTFSAWSVNGLTDAYMLPGHAYVVQAVAADFVNNVSTTYAVILYQPPLATSFGVKPIALNSGITFSPTNLTVQWGGYDRQTIFVNIPDGMDPSNVSVKNDDGALSVDFLDLPRDVTGQPMFRYGSGNMIGIRSGQNSCLTSGRVNVYYEGSIVGSATVAIQAPNRSSATLPWNQMNLRFGPPPIPGDCALPAGDPKRLICRADLWAIAFGGENPSSINQLYFIEDEGYAGRLGAMPMCPLTEATIAQASALPAVRVVDAQGFVWLPTLQNIKRFRKCGATSTQNWNFKSFYPKVPGQDVIKPSRDTAYAECTFITGVRKTAQLDGQNPPNVSTTRSDKQ